MCISHQKNSRNFQIFRIIQLKDLKQQVSLQFYIKHFKNDPCHGTS